MFFSYLPYFENRIRKSFESFDFIGLLIVEKNFNAFENARTTYFSQNFEI